MIVNNIVRTNRGNVIDVEIIEKSMVWWVILVGSKSNRWIR